jgi:D-amino-acid dehydrogenase
MGELQKTSMALFKELAATEKIDMGFLQSGIVEAYRDRGQFIKGRRTARFLRKFDLANRILDKDAIDALFAGLRNHFVGGIHYQHDGHLIPERFVRSLADHAAQNGTVFRTGTEVIGMKRTGRRITSVQTTRGDIRADEIVLAAGAWSPQIARDLRLKLMVQPAKGYSITYRRPDRFPHMPLILVEAKVAVTPMDANLRFAGTLELAGWDFSIKSRRVAAIIKSIPGYLPDIEPQRLELLEIWRGPRPCTPDGLPYIGRPRGIDNLIVATGHAMKGISLAPITGKLVAQLAARQRPEIDLAALNIERFA